MPVDEKTIPLKTEPLKPEPEKEEVKGSEPEKPKPISRLELLAGMLSQPALTPEIQTPQKTFSYALSFWKLCLECRKILNEEKRDKTK